MASWVAVLLRFSLGLLVSAGGRYDGEYGLWVKEAGDSLEVHWITRDSVSGYLKVALAGAPAFEARTEPGKAHRVVLQRPLMEAIVLSYGAAGDPNDAHQTTLYFDLPERPLVTEFEGVDSLFVVGDVHGQYDTLKAVFRNAGLIDEAEGWTGGHSHLVLLGDLFDRGRDVTRTLWFLYRLEREAARHGGRVHILLGNHEIMAMTDDTRYVSRKERALADLHAAAYWQLFDPRSSVLGKWLASKPALIRIDGVLMAHAGVGPAYMHYSIPEFDDSLARFLSEDWFRRLADTTMALPTMDTLTLNRRIDFFYGDASVFWFREYVTTDTLRTVLDEVLDRYSSVLHVIGHTPIDSVRQLYGGDVIAVDLLEPARQMLLLVKRWSGYERYRYTSSGPPERLPFP